MQISGSQHLTYCTNVHPGENWEVTFTQLKKHLPSIKEKVGHEGQFGLGLRLSNIASEELGLGEQLLEFKSWLKAMDVYVFTMNGFPYGNFHADRVKDKVHAPDWTTPERVEYTLRLFKQLSILLPEGISGGISTSPISYKHWHKSEDRVGVFNKGAAHMLHIASKLHEIEQQTGQYLHLDIEPEPDGLLENSAEVLEFFTTYLIPLGISFFKNSLGVNAEQAEILVKRYLTVCYDVCHFSLAFEEPKHTFSVFKQAGIQIGKIQISSALKVIYDENRAEEIWKTLALFDEPIYLHQVTQQEGELVTTYPDLSSILSKRERFSEVRAHFHVPLFLEKYGVLHSTQDQIIKVFNYLKEDAISNHLEVETYTWEVLPKELKKELSVSIARELNWVKEHL